LTSKNCIAIEKRIGVKKTSPTNHVVLSIDEVDLATKFYDRYYAKQNYWKGFYG